MDTQPDWHRQGCSLRDQGQPEEALACFVHAAESQPDCAPAVRDLARLLLRELHRPAQALPWVEHALRLEPTQTQACLMRADALRMLDRLDDALAEIDRHPEFAGNARALNLRALILLHLRRFEESLACFDRAIALEPDSGFGLNRTLALVGLGHCDEAIAVQDAMLAHDPDLVEALVNKATALMATPRWREAGAVFEHIIRVGTAPVRHDTQFSLALFHLLCGDYPRGWAGFEARWGREERGCAIVNRPRFAAPEWEGGSLEGRSILLYAEQGIGDLIQMVRLVPRVCDMADKVYLQAHSPLHPLLRSLGANCELCDQERTPASTDFVCASMSLPLRLGITLDNLPNEVPYLQAPDDALERWRERLGPARGMRVGLAWSGNARHGNDHNRSIPLAQLMEHAPVGVEFISLQTEVRDSDADALRRCGQLRHFGSELTSFADTAALVHLMDVVLSVDTSVAHLAGAMGKPLSLLLPFMPDWRWLMERSDSPWYPTATLYRQAAPGDWAPGIRRAMDELLQWRRQPEAKDRFPAEILWHATGQRMERNGELARAQDCFDRALAANAQFAPALHDQARLQLRLGRPARTLQCLEALSQTAAHSLEVRMLRAEALRQKGMHADALGIIDALPDAVLAQAAVQGLRGLVLHGLGRAVDSLACFDAALARHPGDADALVHSVLPLIDLERIEEAVARLDQVLVRQPAHAAALNNMVLVLTKSGRRQDAHRYLAAAQDCLKPGDPQLADLWCVMGLEAQSRGDHPEAAKLLRQAIAIRPDSEALWHELGRCMERQGCLDEAYECFTKALDLAPDHAGALRDLALVLVRANLPQEALVRLQPLLQSDPSNIDARVAAAFALHALQRLDEAVGLLDGLPASAQATPDVMNLRGALLHAQGRPDDAVACLNDVVARHPDYMPARLQLAGPLMHLGRHEEAVARMEEVLAREPRAIPALANKALALNFLGKPEQALEVFDAHPDFPWEQDNHATLTRGVILLVQGKFERGWKDYEARWGRVERGNRSAMPNYGIAQWEGEPLRGRSILLFLEQGLGDMIQMLRYVPLVHAMGARIFLQVQSSLHPLLGQMRGMCELLNDGDAVPRVDFVCALMSLPRVLGTTLANVPGDVPYLEAPADALMRWRARLGTARCPRVGLVWSGNAHHSNDHNRSIPLARILEHAPPDVKFISLQQEVRPGDAQALHACKRMRHFGSELTSFADTAALAQLVDVVLSVDTSVAHLAGALGRPLSLLLPFSPDWRWLMDRTDSPWYPTATLYRQTRPGDWSGAIANAMQAVPSTGTARYLRMD